MSADEYQQEDFEFVARIDGSHFWYEGRRMAAGAVLDRFGGGSRRCDILDVGCGHGAMTKTLERYGNVYGFDSNLAGAALCAEGGCRTAVGDALKIPFRDGRFDRVVVFDCLEHIKDDRKVLDECRRVLKPGGLLIIFVPAFRFLWNLVDVYSFHVRRYSRPALLRELKGAGLAVKYSSYFMAALFPVLFLSAMRDKLLKRRSDRVLDWKNKLYIPKFGINRLLIGLLAVEAAVCRRLSLPFGTTLIAVSAREG